MLPMNKVMNNSGLTCVLGPTNTGKTHLAVERMLGHASGMIGCPLRLLAREIYDRVVKAKGPTRVALLTGEEKIIPANPAYYICTTESMPADKPVAFLAVDEVQMAADDQRGHIFTDRILHARGQQETLFLGAETIRPLLTKLFPGANFITRPRFSDLAYVKPKKLSRLPRRSAVVAFSVDDVYGIAELIRRQRGGAAIVMGALSPRTRNAQAALYQSGDVDYLVATDAIGMGLNMDVGHVALAATSKFDGKRQRDLTAAEIGQIAGRAGRYLQNGTFSTTAGMGGELDPLMVAQVEEHSFRPLKKLYWRNVRLDYASLPRLIRDLEARPKQANLQRAPDALDLVILKGLARNKDIARTCGSREAVQTLWDSCQIPDFRNVSPEEHTRLVAKIFGFLMTPDGVIPHDWMAREVTRLNNMQGDIDTLAGRIAGIRIWTYVSHRVRWLKDPAHWAGVTREIENGLSDALHERLTQRFVDRRTSVLLREIRHKDDLLVLVTKDNDVIVEGHRIGHIEGFSFFPDADARGDEEKILIAAAEKSLKGEMSKRVRAFKACDDKDIALDFSAGIGKPRVLWKGKPIATLDKGTAYSPQIRLDQGSLLNPAAADQATERISRWFEARLADKLGALIKLKTALDATAKPDEEAPRLTAKTRGIAFRLVEQFGILDRAQIVDEIKAIALEERKNLHRFGIRIGAYSLFMPVLLKPHATELRLMLWALMTEPDVLPALPPPGMVWVEMEENTPPAFYEIAGFRRTAKKAIRVDMLERLADAVRPLGRENKRFEITPEIMGLVGLSGDGFMAVMRTLGYHGEKQQAAVPAATAKEQETPLGERLFFTWQPKKKNMRPSAPKGKTSPAKKPRKKPQKKPEKKTDPDSPFAALQGLKTALANKK